MNRLARSTSRDPGTGWRGFWFSPSEWPQPTSRRPSTPAHIVVTPGMVGFFTSSTAPQAVACAKSWWLIAWPKT